LRGNLDGYTVNRDDAKADLAAIFAGDLI